MQYLKPDRKTILLVEDDRRLARLMQEFFEKQGFKIVINETGEGFSGMVSAVNPDVIVLDINLPRRDGFELCKEIRPHYSGAVLFVTARESDFDQVIGLELGADDYVIKPVEPRVLLARIEALLRRIDRVKTKSDSGNKVLIFGELQITQNSRDVKLSGNSVALTNIEYELLNHLAVHSGEIIERDSLFQLIYGRAYDGLDRSIDVRISHLRKKLQDNVDNPTRIKTVWGRGYLFVEDAW